VNYVNNEVYPKMDLRTNFTMKTTSYKTIFTRIHPSTHTFANSDILELKNKKMKKITPKKSSLFSILFFLELLSENPEEPNHQDPQNQSKPKHFIRFYSVGVFYLLLSVPTFLCSRTLSTSEKLNFGGGLESTSSVEWKPRGTAPPQCESSK